MSVKNVFEPAIALADIVRVLKKCDLPYFLVGSFASGFRGEFRATNDLDIVCDFDPSKTIDFVLFAKEQFYCDEIAIAEAVNQNRSFNIIHENTFVKVDVFTKITEFEKEQFSLCTDFSIPGMDLSVLVSSAEYNIIAKLNWYLKSNRVLERQILDVKGLVRINRSSLDLAYLHRWAAFFDTATLLNEVLELA